MEVGCILNKPCEPFAPLSLIPGGKVHKACDGWIRQESVERLPIAQDKVSQDKPLSFKGRHLLSRFLPVCFRSDDVRCSCHCTRGPELFSSDSATRLAQRASSLFEANRLSKIFGDTEQFNRDLA